MAAARAADEHPDGFCQVDDRRRVGMRPLGRAAFAQRLVDGAVDGRRVQPKREDVGQLELGRLGRLVLQKVAEALPLVPKVEHVAR